MRISDWSSDVCSSDLTQEAAVVRLEDGERCLTTLRWGLIPFWADDEKVGYRMINARAEGVEKSRAFREAFKRRRCLIPAEGFYEWRSEGRRVGKECGSTCRSRWSPYP